ncbi:MAG: ABC transporter permease [bacterium]|jgi:spermidine/putrescine transport system permease protein|nr:ABC transporter permease [Candidatus Aquidulcis sp.]
MHRLSGLASAIVSRALAVYAALALLYLLLPIITIAIFSFNDPVGRSNYSWAAFTLDNWLTLFQDPTLVKAVGTSLRIALVSTLIATSIGTLMAMALVRYRFRLRKALDLFVFLPLATPEIVLGASLLTLFVTLQIPLGEITLILAHVMFNVSYVVVTMKARLAGFDLRLEEAAADLGATPWQTFWRVTFPLILPGIAASAILAFGLSLDDFVITRFNAGQVQTFPVYIYLKVQKGIPPQVNAFATLFFMATVSLVALGALLQRRRATLKS